MLPLAGVLEWSGLRNCSFLLFVLNQALANFLGEGSDTLQLEQPPTTVEAPAWLRSNKTSLQKQAVAAVGLRVSTSSLNGKWLNDDKKIRNSFSEP